MHAGRDEDRQERRRAGSVRLRLAALLGLALGWPQPAGAALGAPEEALTTFEILRPTDLDPALAEELRQAPSERALRQGVVDLPAQATRTVTISWTAKERPGLEGYRLTALIDGGPLSGLAGRWHVTAAGSDGSGTARTYRVRWLLPLAGAPRVRVAIEALEGGGVGPLLAVRQGDGWPLGAEAATRHVTAPRRASGGSPSRWTRDDRRPAILVEQAQAPLPTQQQSAEAGIGQPARPATAPLSRGPPTAPGPAAFVS